MDKINLPEKTSNEVLERIGKKMMLINDILGRKVNWIGHILRIMCLLHDATKGEMTEIKGVERKIQLIDILRN